jgi:hypothetical protein
LNAPTKYPNQEAGRYHPMIDEVVARVIYARVTDEATHHAFDPFVACLDLDTGKKFEIHGKDFINSLVSASYFDESKEATKTELAELLVNAGFKPFTVVFEKMDGSLRTLVGVMLRHESLLGRSMVRELATGRKEAERKDDNGIRLVDHRTIQSLIIDGVRYMLKEDSRAKSKSSQKRDIRPAGGRDALGRYTKAAGYRY